MRLIVFRLSQGLLVSGVLCFIGAIALAMRVPSGQFVSLGTIGPYSVLGHRDGLLISRRIRVWKKLNPSYLGIAVIIPGGIGFAATLRRRRNPPELSPPPQ